MKRVVLLIVMALVVGAPLFVRGDEVDVAYRDFLAGRYGPVFSRLFAYRVTNEGTLRVDFMLGVSACRLSNPDFRALGSLLLAQIPTWYGPLKSDLLADVQRQAASCPAAQVSFPEAVRKAKASGTYDGPADSAFHSGHSRRGNDQPLPRASVSIPPPNGMGPLLRGRGYLGGTDYRNTRTPSAETCADICATENQCVAMTFDANNNTCWLKNGLTTLGDSANFTSARKLGK